VDIIQLECLSRSSSLLNITRGPLNGKIWIQNGEIIDAATAQMTGEEAFKEILSWKSGNFEILPPDPARPRAIHLSYQGLLLDSAQMLDESSATPAGAPTDAPDQTPAGPQTGLAALGRFDGVAFLLAIPPDHRAPVDSWRLDNSLDVANWVRDTHDRLVQIGQSLQAGELSAAFGFGLQDHWAVTASDRKGLLCAGFRPALSREQVEQTMNHIFDKWAS
jgi:hypothetical protein